MTTFRGRRRNLAHSELRVSTYTLDGAFLNTYELDGFDSPQKFQPLGSVLSVYPDTLTVFPHHLTYGIPPFGVLLTDTIWREAGTEVGVIVEGNVLENACWDDGDYGVVTDETKEALRDRIRFVSDKIPRIRGNPYE